MEAISVVKVAAGEFTIKNELTVGDDIQIASRRATISNGMYGQMMESPNRVEMRAAFTIFRVAELDGRITKGPEEWHGCEALTPDELDELWKVWTEKSGLFLRKQETDDAPAADSGEGKD